MDNAVTMGNGRTLFFFFTLKITFTKQYSYLNKNFTFFKFCFLHFFYKSISFTDNLNWSVCNLTEFGFLATTAQPIFIISTAANLAVMEFEFPTNNFSHEGWSLCSRYVLCILDRNNLFHQYFVLKWVFSIICRKTKLVKICSVKIRKIDTCFWRNRNFPIW